MAKYTKTAYKKAIENSGGIFSVVAQKLGISRPAVTMFLSKPENFELLKMMRAEKEKTIDLAENKLLKLIEDGDFQAIKFYLVSQAKARGYVERTDQFNFLKNGPSYTFEVIKPDDNKNTVETKPKTTPRI